jgi:hypothetical protein
MLALGLLPRAARAEGYSARPFRLAVDRESVGTIDGAHAPAAGTLDVAVATDYVRGPLLLTGSDGTQALLSGRWVLEPAITLGLPSAFALYGRLPFAVLDTGIDRTGDLTTTGLFPPIVGGLVPLHRDPRSNGRLSLRAEATLPMGDSSSFRGDDAMTGRVGLVYGGPLLGAFTVVSAGAVFAPARSEWADPIGGTSVVVGAAARYPAAARMGVVISVDSRVQTAGQNEVIALASGGVDLHIGGASLRALAGAQTDFQSGTTNVWLGLAWIQGVRAAASPARTLASAATPE